MDESARAVYHDTFLPVSCLMPGYREKTKRRYLGFAPSSSASGHSKIPPSELPRLFIVRDHFRQCCPVLIRATP